MGDGQRSRSLQRWQILVHLAIEKRQLQQVLRQIEHSTVLSNFGDFTVPLKEPVRRCLTDLELNHSQDVLLHDKDRIFVDRVLGVSDEVTQLWRVDLFILSRNKEASDAEQLHVVLLRLLVGEVAVQQIDCDEERLWQQPEAGVSVHQPLNDVCADVLIELGLPFHVEEIGLGLVFGLLHVLSDAVDVL